MKNHLNVFKIQIVKDQPSISVASPRRWLARPVQNNLCLFQFLRVHGKWRLVQRRDMNTTYTEVAPQPLKTQMKLFKLTRLAQVTLCCNTSHIQDLSQGLKYGRPNIRFQLNLDTYAPGKLIVQGLT